MEEVITRTRWFHRRHVELHVSDSGIAVLSRNLFPRFGETSHLLSWDDVSAAAAESFPD